MNTETPHVSIPDDCVSVCARALKSYEDVHTNVLANNMPAPAIKAFLEKELADIKTAQAMLARSLPVTN